MTKKIWTKVLGLTEKDLEKEGEEVVLAESEVSTKGGSAVGGKAQKKRGTEKEEEWFLPQEGQLTIDLYEKGDFLIIESAIAGVKSQDLEINIESDLLRIKGKRVKEKDGKKNYFYQECFWGSFSRTVVLPLSVKADGVKAVINNGILTITLPKKEEKEGLEIEKNDENFIQ